LSNLYINDHFAKTGSGQTKENVKGKGRCCQTARRRRLWMAQLTAFVEAPREVQEALLAPADNIAPCEPPPPRGSSSLGGVKTLTETAIDPPPPPSCALASREKRTFAWCALSCISPA